MSDIITVNDLNLWYGPTQALHHVTISVPEHSITALIGPSGCGKSTFLKTLDRMNDLIPGVKVEGQVLYKGQDIYAPGVDVSQLRREVGMVFQNPDNQIVAAIVEEDVAFGPENIGVPGPEIPQRVADSLAAVGMTEYAKHAPHLLSGGQKQRVAIAGILALQPECIVLDEPTAMLDPQGRKEIVGTVRKLNEEKNMTIVYITHYMVEALAADRVVVMEKGHIRFMGTPREVFSRVDELEALGLEAPLAAKVASELRKSGVKLPQDIITDEELAQALCQ